ncbi:18125_t:CDS:2 [Rhizophagus irregularis]|nr:18125_t:CDS:2 [Rhizophagus irregularis]
MADELPKDVAKWSIDDVETYLTFKMDGFDEDDIKAIKDGGVNGKCLFQLTAGILVSEEFKIKFTHAVAIMELVKELNDKRDKEVEEQLESLSLDKTKKTPEIDASRNVNASKDVFLYQLFNEGYIKQGDLLLYCRNSNTHGTVSFVRKIVNVNENNQIITSLPDDSQESLSKSLTQLEKTVVDDINNDRRFNDNNKLKPNNNPFPYFFVGTSLFELRKKYEERNTKRNTLTESIFIADVLNLSVLPLIIHNMESRAVTSSFFIEKISILIGIAIIMYTVKHFEESLKPLHPQPLYCGIASINARIEILPWRRQAFSIELITSSKSLMISMNERLAAQPRLLNKESETAKKQNETESIISSDNSSSNISSESVSYDIWTRFKQIVGGIMTEKNLTLDEACNKIAVEINDYGKGNICAQTIKNFYKTNNSHSKTLDKINVWQSGGAMAFVIPERTTFWK